MGDFVRNVDDVGGRLSMRRTDCEGESPRVRYTTARIPFAWRRRGGCMAARGARAAGRATVHLPPLPYAMALAPTAESLPAPKTFLQKRLSHKGYPFMGRNHFWTGFCQTGHE